MISLDELRKISRLKGIDNLGYAEKDYLLDLTLLSLSKSTKNELVFKGGTCLYKFYNLNRFSEDIDFSAVKEIDSGILIKKILIDLKTFGMDGEIKEKKEAYNSILWTLKAKGLLFDGDSRSACNIKVDINFKSEVFFKPEAKNYNSLYTDIPSYSLLIMQEKEILAEKVRAIIERNYARDVYDLWFLLNKGVGLDLDLINRKLSYYEKKFNKKEFFRKVKEKGRIWDTELKHLIINNLPDFKIVEKDILNKFLAID